MKWSKTNKFLLELSYRLLIGMAIILVILILYKLFLPIILLSILCFLIGLINIKLDEDENIIQGEYKEKNENYE